MLHKSLITGLLAATLLITACSYFQNKNASTLTIPVIVFAHHPALDATAAGLKAVLQKENIAVAAYNAQGEIATALQIAKQCAAEEPAVMVGIATPAAQAVNKARNKEKTLLGFAAVSDPHGAHLDTEPLVIGVADTPPVDLLIQTVQNLMPDAKTIGVIYNPSEINSTYAIEKLKKIADDASLKLCIKGVTNASMIKVAAQELINDGIDLIYVPLDNFMVSSLAILNLVATEQHIPLVANDPALITQGITLAVGPDFEESGKQLGELIVKHINGIQIEEPIQLSRVNKTVLNKAHAATFKLDATRINAELA
jgi:putative ABC transport system substrate-binding protein